MRLVIGSRKSGPGRLALFFGGLLYLGSVTLLPTRGQCKIHEREIFEISIASGEKERPVIPPQSCASIILSTISTGSRGSRKFDQRDFYDASDQWKSAKRLAYREGKEHGSVARFGTRSILHLKRLWPGVSMEGK